MKTVKLKNGLWAIYEPMKHSRTVAISFTTNAGGEMEGEGEHGMSHLVEHVLFKGTRQRDWRRINLDLKLCGAKSNAETRMSRVDYYMEFPSDEIEPAFDLFSDIIFSPSFPDEQVEMEKNVVVEEIKSAQDSPDQSFFEESNKTHLVPEVGHHIRGEADGVLGMTSGACRDFYRNNYLLGSSVMAIAGAVDWQDVHRLLRKNFDRFSSMSQTSQREGVKGIWKSLPGARFEMERHDIQQAHILVLMPSVPFSGPAAEPHRMMLSVLGGDEHSVLWTTMREELGLCYHVGAGIDTDIENAYRSLSYIYCVVDKEKVDEAEGRIIECVRQVREGDYADEVFDCAKKSVLGELSIALNSPLATCMNLAWRNLFGKRVEPEDLFEMEKAVTRDQVQAAAEAWLDDGNFRYSRLMPS
jgi:predicted Zn-dependent peptidase